MNNDTIDLFNFLGGLITFSSCFFFFSCGMVILFDFIWTRLKLPHSNLIYPIAIPLGLFSGFCFGRFLFFNLIYLSPVS